MERRIRKWRLDRTVLQRSGIQQRAWRNLSDFVQRRNGVGKLYHADDGDRAELPRQRIGPDERPAGLQSVLRRRDQKDFELSLPAQHGQRLCHAVLSAGGVHGSDGIESRMSQWRGQQRRHGRAGRFLHLRHHKRHGTV